MRIKFFAVISGLLGAVAIALALVGTSSAQASTFSPAVTSSTHASARPATTQKVTATVRCGKFVGEIKHGGLGGILDRAYLQVEGKLSSSCNSTTYIDVRYDTGLESFPGTVLNTHAGAHKTVDVDWEVHSIEGAYGHIGIRVGTTDGMPKGKIFWGKWVNV